MAIFNVRLGVSQEIEADSEDEAVDEFWEDFDLVCERDDVIVEKVEE
jgi:hypothetical protein